MTTNVRSIVPRPRRNSHAPGFTLIELLVVIAIIALLLAILLPSLAKAREQGKAAVCQSNLKDIMSSTTMYLNEANDGMIRWYTLEAYQNWGSFTVITPYVFGGCRSPSNDRPGPRNAYRDCQRYPVNTFNGGPDPSNPSQNIDLRPLNKLVAPEARDDDLLEVYRCPSDRTTEIGELGGSLPSSIPEEEVNSSWTSFGSSYSLNTRFLQGYAYPNFGSITNTVAQWKRIVPHMVGGKAARFVLWVEHGFYARTNRAAHILSASQATPAQNGWHKEFSKWSVGFADGHARYGYYNTRLSMGPEWTIWQPGWVP